MVSMPTSTNGVMRTCLTWLFGGHVPEKYQLTWIVYWAGSQSWGIDFGNHVYKVIIALQKYDKLLGKQTHSSIQPPNIL